MSRTTADKRQILIRKPCNFGKSLCDRIWFTKNLGSLMTGNES